jgi:hypothetical protein
MESPNQTELQTVSKQRHVFKMNLKNQHLLAFALALLRTDEFDPQTFVKLCADKGIDLTGPVDEQNEAMDALFWNKAKESRKAFNDFVRKTNLRQKKASATKNQEKQVKRKYIRKSKVEAAEETTSEPKDEVEGEVRQKRKYTRKPKVVDTPATVEETTAPETVVETVPETDVPKKRKYTRKPKDVPVEAVAVEEAPVVVEAVAVEEAAVAVEKPPTEEVRPKRAYNKKPVDQVAQPNPFDRFKVKINKKLEQQTSTIDELKRKLDKNYVEQQQSNQQLLDRLELATQKTQQ